MNSIRHFVIVFSLHLLLSACATPGWLARDGALPGLQDTAGTDIAAAAPGKPYQQDRGSVPADAVRRFERALAAMAQQKPELALKELHYLAENYPRLSGPGLNLALMYRRAGDPEQAESWFESCLSSNPDNLDAYNEFGIFLREQGRFAEAEQVYLDALAVWEAYPATHRNIGVLYDLYMGDRERALKHFYRYQALTSAEDRAVAGWIADLERQQMVLVRGG